MPYRWTLNQKAPVQTGAFSLGSGDTLTLRLWPHRSLTAQGFAIFIATTATVLSVPLMAALGTAVLWALLPFILVAIAGVWWALRRNLRDRQITEELTLTRDRAILARRDPDGQARTWEANPYWVRVTLHPTGGPVPDYLTLAGDGREVELGAFLTSEERVEIGRDLGHLLPLRR